MTCQKGCTYLELDLKNNHRTIGQIYHWIFLENCLDWNFSKKWEHLWGTGFPQGTKSGTLDRAKFNKNVSIIECSSIPELILFWFLNKFWIDTWTNFVGSTNFFENEDLVSINVLYFENLVVRFQCHLYGGREVKITLQ